MSGNPGPEINAFIDDTTDLQARLNEVAEEVVNSEFVRPSELKRTLKAQSLLTQYSVSGKYFVPTTKSTKTLPVGVYRPVFLQNVGIALDPMDLVTDRILRLPDSKTDEVLNEIAHFWTVRQAYEKFGLSYKRGFLLHGPPGSGKTSTVALVIEQMVKQGGIVIFGDSPPILAESLKKIREIEPIRPITVILEDLDAIIARYKETEVLSLLDGELQIDNVVFIATTNYPEVLDQRITNRPSRFDKLIKIDIPNEAARRMYLESRIPGEDISDLLAVSAGFSIAHMRELVVATNVLGHDLAETVERLKKMKYTPKSTQGSNKIGLTRED